MRAEGCSGLELQPVSRRCAAMVSIYLMALNSSVAVAYRWPSGGVNLCGIESVSTDPHPSFLDGLHQRPLPLGFEGEAGGGRWV